jgi:glutathione S-transferase
MKIYNSSTAPNPRRVRIFLAEKGIRIPYEEVDIVNAVNRGSEFRKKNPLATVPVLELDDGTCISESVSICRFFEELPSQSSTVWYRCEGPGNRRYVEPPDGIRRTPADRRRIPAAPRIF